MWNLVQVRISMQCWRGAEPTSGMKDMKMTLSYEDEAGQVATAEKTFQLEITEMEDTQL